jgi:hypothetical protein
MWTWFYRLASPPYVYALRRRSRPGCCWRRRVHRLWVDRGLRSRRPTTSRAMRFASFTCMRRAPGCRCSAIPPWRWPAASGSSGASRWAMRWRRGGAHRRLVHAARAGHRFAVGPADVGHLLGLGPAAHLGADPVVSVCRRDVAARGVRGPGARRPGGGAAGDRRRRQRADHSLLGAMVELTASGRTVAKLRQTVHAGSMLWPLLSMLLGFMCSSARCCACGCAAKCSIASASRRGCGRRSNHDERRAFGRWGGTRAMSGRASRFASRCRVEPMVGAALSRRGAEARAARAGDGHGEKS